MNETLTRSAKPAHLTTGFRLQCPLCRGAVLVDGMAAHCAACGLVFERTRGIWRFLPGGRRRAFGEFLRHYKLVRAVEGWGAAEDTYYQRLPWTGRDDPHADVWRIRARHYERLAQRIQDAGRQRILDAGAGNGWLSHRLMCLGHEVASLDLSDDERDGLGARVHYALPLACYQAEFNRMPFESRQFNLVIFNAALHYASALVETLAEARRVMAPGGRIVVMDTPFYDHAASGRAMLAERESNWQSLRGPRWPISTIGFLTPASLESAAAQVGLSVRVWAADNEWHKQVRRFWFHLRKGREPARFPLIVLESMHKVKEDAWLS